MSVILPVSVVFIIIRHIAQASQWQPIVLISPPFTMKAAACGPPLAFDQNLMHVVPP